MHLTMQVKLLPAPEQSAALLATMERFNAACDAIAEVAHANGCANKVELQKLVYHDMRQRFGLSAQMTVRAIGKVVEVYKRDRRLLPRFRPHGAVPYDQRILSWKGIDRVSVLTLGGREVMPWVAGAYQHARLAFPRGQADLVFRDGAFYLFVTVDVGDVPPGDPSGWLGIDLGIANVATDSDGDASAGDRLNGLRDRHARLRKRLQKKRTKSALRLLSKRRRKERRFAANENHRISKAIVRKARDTGRGVAVEDLTGIRGRTTVRREQRRARHSWAFHQLRAFLTYKAALAGVPLVAVDPRHTSQACPECGCVDRKNRPWRDRFQCVSCAFAGAADHIAARNIASRGAAGWAAVMRPDAGPETALASLRL